MGLLSFLHCVHFLCFFHSLHFFTFFTLNELLSPSQCTHKAHLFFRFENQASPASQNMSCSPKTHGVHDLGFDNSRSYQTSWLGDRVSVCHLLFVKYGCSAVLTKCTETACSLRSDSVSYRNLIESRLPPGDCAHSQLPTWLLNHFISSRHASCVLVEAPRSVPTARMPATARKVCFTDFKVNSF